MRDLNTVGLISAAECKSDTKMGSPRPGYGRVNRVYESQGSYGYGRLGSPTGGRKYHNSDVLIDSNTVPRLRTPT